MKQCGIWRKPGCTYSDINRKISAVWNPPGPYWFYTSLAKLFLLLWLVLLSPTVSPDLMLYWSGTFPRYWRDRSSLKSQMGCCLSWCTDSSATNNSAASPQHHVPPQDLSLWWILMMLVSLVQSRRIFQHNGKGETGMLHVKLVPRSVVYNTQELRMMVPNDIVLRPCMWSYHSNWSDDLSSPHVIPPSPLNNFQSWLELGHVGEANSRTEAPLFVPEMPCPDFANREWRTMWFGRGRGRGRGV